MSIGKMDLGILKPEERAELKGLFQKASATGGDMMPGNAPGAEGGQGGVSASGVYDKIDSLITDYGTDEILQTFGPMLYDQKNKDAEGSFKKIDRQKVEKKLKQLSPEQLRGLNSDLEERIKVMSSDDDAGQADFYRGEE